MAVFADFNKVYGRNFIGKPACSTIAVKTLPYGVIDNKLELIACIK